MKRFSWCFLLLVLAGCATAPPAQDTLGPPESKVEGRDVPQEAGDQVLFDEAAALLAGGERPESAKVRALLAALQERYPQSRFRPVAGALLGLIKANEAGKAALDRQNLRQEELRRDSERLGREVEQLKRKMKELTERHGAEIAALVQENERLKNDLQRLKELEIELEKRKLR